VVKTIATEGFGIAEAAAAIDAVPACDRTPLWAWRLREMLRARVLDRFSLPDLQQAAAEVAARRKDPYSVVDEWLERI
jgi:hypothetical protein